MWELCEVELLLSSHVTVVQSFDPLSVGKDRDCSFSCDRVMRVTSRGSSSQDIHNIVFEGTTRESPTQDPSLSTLCHPEHRQLPTAQLSFSSPSTYHFSAGFLRHVHVSLDVGVHLLTVSLHPRTAWLKFWNEWTVVKLHHGVPILLLSIALVQQW